MALESQHELERRYVQQWKTTGPLLARMERDELREMDERARLQAIDDLIDLADAWTGPAPTSSGLVEMQRLFAARCP